MMDRLFSSPTAPSTLSVAQRKQVLQIIWAAMVVAILCYSGVHWLIGRTPGPSTPLAIMTIILAVQAVFAYLGTWWWYRMTAGAVAEQIIPTKFMRLSPQEKSALQNRLQLSAIVCAALLEVPPIFGLVNTFMGLGSTHLFEWLAGASLLGLVVLRLRGYPTLFGLLEKLEVRAGAPS